MCQRHQGPQLETKKGATIKTEDLYLPSVSSYDTLRMMSSFFRRAPCCEMPADTGAGAAALRT